MAIPTYEELMLPLLNEYRQAHSPCSIKDLMPLVAKKLNLSPEDLAERLPSGRQGVFHNRLHWAKTYMARAGLLDSPARGVAVITERGKGLLARNPDRIDGALLSQFDEFTEWKEVSSTQDLTSSTSDGDAGKEGSKRTPEERIELARRELERALKDDLLLKVRSMDPGDFEELIIQLLLRMGYGSGAEEMAEALGGSGDQGIDGVIHQDPLGLDRVYIQAKRYGDGNSVGSGAIRDFNGALDLKRAPKGLFVTSSSFSRDAQLQAESATRQITLIDGEDLAALMIKYRVGTRVVTSIKIQELDEGFFGA